VHRSPLPQWQIFHAIRKVLGLASQGDDFEVSDTLPNRHVQLMRIDDASKWLTAFLTLGGFTQKVFILRKQDTTKFGGTIQQDIVFYLVSPIFLRREYLGTSQT
jgi:hypothetical protein